MSPPQVLVGFYTSCCCLQKFGQRTTEPVSSFAISVLINLMFNGAVSGWTAFLGGILVLQHTKLTQENNAFFTLQLQLLDNCIYFTVLHIIIHVQKKPRRVIHMYFLLTAEQKQCTGCMLFASCRQPDSASHSFLRWSFPSPDSLPGGHSSCPGPRAGRPWVAGSGGGGGEPADPPAAQPIAGYGWPGSGW